MSVHFAFQPDVFAVNSTSFSNGTEAPRSILWGAFLTNTTALHVSHHIFMVAIPYTNSIRKGLQFTCRPPSEKTMSHVFLNPLTDNCTLQITGNRS